MTDPTMGSGDGAWARRFGGAHPHGRWQGDAGERVPPGRGRSAFRGRRGMGGPGPGFTWGGPGFAWGGPGRPRQRRGDVRIAILWLLGEQPMHGYQIITELTERSGGEWRPSPGSIYPTLQQLEDEGLVAASEQDGRRTFSLTEAGRTEHARITGGGRPPWEEMDGGVGHRHDLRREAAQVMHAAMQVAQAGDDAQLARAGALLREVRRALYRLLAEDDTTDES